MNKKERPEVTSQKGNGSVSFKLSLYESFRPLAEMKMEWMWEGISGLQIADLCKESCKFGLHEQLVAKEQSCI